MLDGQMRLTLMLKTMTSFFLGDKQEGAVMCGLKIYLLVSFKINKYNDKLTL